MFLTFRDCARLAFITAAFYPFSASLQVCLGSSEAWSAVIINLCPGLLVKDSSLRARSHCVWRREHAPKAAFVEKIHFLCVGRNLNTSKEPACLWPSFWSNKQQGTTTGLDRFTRESQIKRKLSFPVDFNWCKMRPRTSDCHNGKWHMFAHVYASFLRACSSCPKALAFAHENTTDLVDPSFLSKLGPTAMALLEITRLWPEITIWNHQSDWRRHLPSDKKHDFVTKPLRKKMKCFSFILKKKNLSDIAATLAWEVLRMSVLNKRLETLKRSAVADDFSLIFFCKGPNLPATTKRFSSKSVIASRRFYDHPQKRPGPRPPHDGVLKIHDTRCHSSWNPLQGTNRWT